MRHAPRFGHGDARDTREAEQLRGSRCVPKGLLRRRFAPPRNDDAHAAGVSLIEVLIGVVVFALIATSMYAALGTLLRSSTTARARVAGLALANERIEVIRNLSYDNVGTVEGLPKGSVPQLETITRDGFPFTVRTTVRSTDDSYDGTIGGSPNDTAPADYKSVTVRLECPTCRDPFPALEVTTVVSKGLELAAGNGALYVRVFNAAGSPVEGAAIDVQRTSGAAFTVRDATDRDGYVRLLDVPPGTNVYRVTATKAGFSTDRTYPPGDSANPNPLNPDGTVVAGEVASVGLAIDQTSTVNVSTVNPTSCAAVGDVDLRVEGAKLIGTNPDVKKYTADVVTSAGGTLSLSPQEWDTYDFRMSDLAFDLAGASPALPLALPPNVTTALTLLARATEPESLLISVRAAGTNEPINGASVRLVEANQTKNTGEGSAGCAPPGQAFFFALASGTHTVEVSAAGYTSQTLTAEVSGEARLSITLSPV